MAVLILDPSGKTDQAADKGDRVADLAEQQTLAFGTESIEMGRLGQDLTLTLCTNMVTEGSGTGIRNQDYVLQPGGVNCAQNQLGRQTGRSRRPHPHSGTERGQRGNTAMGRQMGKKEGIKYSRRRSCNLTHWYFYSFITRLHWRKHKLACVRL